MGLEGGGWDHVGLVDNDPGACSTLRSNRPFWKVIEQDVAAIDGRQFRGVDMLAGGLPCPPFSVAGKRRGAGDERDLFPQALRLAFESEPRALMLENVRGITSQRFARYMEQLLGDIRGLGYHPEWRLLRACDFGVSQVRPRFVLVALRRQDAERFRWPEARGVVPPTVGEMLVDLMAAGGWRGAEKWADRAAGLAPTIVGGSKRHGGADLGPVGSQKVLGGDRGGRQGNRGSPSAYRPRSEGSPETDRADGGAPTGVP